jgi:hypothetical protein
MEIRDELAAKASKDFGVKLQSVHRHNLVVNSGRLMTCRKLAERDLNAVIYAVQFGDCKVDGVVSKDLFPPDLSDNRLVREIRTIGGAPGATFELDGYEYPEQVVKVAPAGLPGSLTGGEVSTFTDASSDFVVAGVTDDDVVNAVIGGESFTLPIKRVVGPHDLEVENNGGIAGAGISYTITTPAGQVLFRKFVSGENFPTSLYGPMTIAHEAGLLFSDGTLFNRVVFAPSSPTNGLIFQPMDINGVTLGVQVDWLIVI